MKKSRNLLCRQEARQIPGLLHLYSFVLGQTDMALPILLRTFQGYFLHIFHHIRHFKNSRWCKIGVLMENVAQKPSVFKALRVLYNYCRGTQKVS